MGKCQKAHQKIVLLERLEEQLAQMIAKRQDLHEELRIVQRHINEELEQRINVNGESPTRILNSSPKPNPRFQRL